MSPFIFDPKKVATVEQFNYIDGLWANEVAQNVAIGQTLHEPLVATRSVLLQNNPGLENDIDLLIAQAQLIGHQEGLRQALDTVRSQFRAALPFGLKARLNAPAVPVPVAPA